jgi:hypothetical protein
MSQAQQSSTGNASEGESQVRIFLPHSVDAITPWCMEAVVRQCPRFMAFGVDASLLVSLGTGAFRFSTGVMTHWCILILNLYVAGKKV